MWYDYIGSEQCGWRLIRKGSVISGMYNYINHKKENLFPEWLEYAESFIESEQIAVMMRPGDSEFMVIDTNGKIIGTQEFPF